MKQVNCPVCGKEYVSGKDKRLSRLIQYAQALGVRDEVMKYVEVLE